MMTFRDSFTTDGLSAYLNNIYIKKKKNQAHNGNPKLQISFQYKNISITEKKQILGAILNFYVPTITKSI